MKNEQLYNETVNIILDAYNKKQLKSGTPCGCFIGNIVAHRQGVTDSYSDGTPRYDYHWYSGVISPMKYPAVPSEHFVLIGGQPAKRDEGLKQIALTGYEVEEVLAMEVAFEHAANEWKYKHHGIVRHSDEVLNEANYRGMKAALIKLAEIHEVREEESITKLDKIREEVYENCACV